MNHDVIAFIFQVSEHGEWGIGEEAGEKKKEKETTEESETKLMKKQSRKRRLLSVASLAMPRLIFSVFRRRLFLTAGAPKKENKPANGSNGNRNRPASAVETVSCVCHIRAGVSGSEMRSATRPPALTAPPTNLAAQP